MDQPSTQYFLSEFRGHILRLSMYLLCRPFRWRPNPGEAMWGYVRFTIQYFLYVIFSSEKWIKSQFADIFRGLWGNNGSYWSYLFLQLIPPQYLPPQNRIHDSKKLFPPLYVYICVCIFLELFLGPLRKPCINLGKVSIASLPIYGPVKAPSAPTLGGGVGVLGILGTLGTLTHGIRKCRQRSK